jgi:hypothetical protein
MVEVIDKVGLGCSSGFQMFVDMDILELRQA